ncbi:alpha/beta fold hydrolase [Legionella jordanis]|uniref:Hydrolase/acyltransferase n=1 Tax=Legionella jordanis TaxID=456 RepID=A0A0W0VAY6_9GAMM|nr:alpha/beta hydrolase [Legionella jordanis]KTD17053.1 hydrolase/acyltransferase [Legionella jordanis]RMX03188.1 alpha/beta hydrolase [Legionella jordanis]RMX18673.1 alpha/beta hydrolase [Legionella jordanis]VEH12750.1 hydrolase [Legionella jordanis]HAT8713103.1 alpha/beta fold hydrolase [Legionella jordanis]
MKLDYVMCASEEGFHKVVYSEWGLSEQNGSAVICVHGLTRNRHDFDPLAQFLSADGHHVFCPDIVGRGDSDWLKNFKHYNYQQYILDMNVLIARTGAKRLHWIGTSMGGLIGMFLAGLPNSPIQSLILNDIGPQLPLDALGRLNQYVGRSNRFKTLEEAKQHYKTIHSGFGELTEDQWDYVTRHSIKEQSPGVFVPKVDPHIKASKPATQLLKEFFSNPHRALEGIFFDIDLWYLWQKVKCPVLVIHGKKSDLLLPEYIRRMQRSHPSVDVFEIEEAGHAPILFHRREHEMIANWLPGDKELQKIRTLVD